MLIIGFCLYLNKSNQSIVHIICFHSNVFFIMFMSQCLTVCFRTKEVAAAFLKEKTEQTLILVSICIRMHRLDERVEAIGIKGE